MSKKGIFKLVKSFILTICMLLCCAMNTGVVTVYADGYIPENPTGYSMEITPFVDLDFGVITQGDDVEPKEIYVANTGYTNFTYDIKFASGEYFNLTLVDGPEDNTLEPYDESRYEVTVKEGLEASDEIYTDIFYFYNVDDPDGGLTVVAYVLVKPAPCVTEVIVTPGSATVQAGESCSFSAEVIGEYDFDSSVIWSVEGNTADNTEIDENGLLTVGSDEDASYVTVRATSVQDPDIYAEANVEIVYIEHEVSAFAEPSEGGTVSGGGMVRDGGNIRLSATPNEGYVFDGWYRDDVLVATEPRIRVLKISSDIELVAKFQKKTFTVTTLVNDPDAGDITPGGTVEYGDDFTVTAFLLKSGYKFKGFSENGEILSEDSTYTITNIISDREITAEFVKTYNITTHVNNSDAGTITQGKTVARGDSFTITATAEDGYIFKRFTENGETLSESNPYTITSITSDRDITAEFVKAYKVTTHVNNSDAGTITQGKTVARGDSFTITATAEDGYKFKRFTENGETLSKNNPYTLEDITSNRDITAEFEKLKYNIETHVNDPDAGTITAGKEVDYGAKYTITATAKTGYKFKRFTENGSTISESKQLELTSISSDRDITAEFVKTYTVTATISPSSSGTVENAGTYEAGEQVWLKAIPNEGYDFVGWAISSQTVSTDPEYLTEALEKNITITATFKKQEARKHTIASGVANEGGKISPSGNTSVEEGKSLTYTMTPNSGYRVHNVAIDGVGIGAVDSYTFSNVYEQHSIAVSFEKIPEKAASQSENLNNRSNGSEDQEDTEDSEDADEALKVELANEAENKSSTPRLIERRNMTEQTEENVHESDAVEQFDEPFIIEEEETAKAASAEAMMDSNSLSATGGNSSIINPLVIRIVVILLLATVFGSIVYTYYWLFNNKDGKA